MKQQRRRRLIIIPLVLLAALILAACRIQNTPDGWSAPLPIDAKDDVELLLIRSDRDHIIALDIERQTEIWAFPGPEDEFPGLVDEVDARGFYGTPAPLEGGEEFLIGDYENGIVYAVRIDGTSARIIFDTEDRIVAGIVAEGTTAYIATTDGRVIAVDTERPETTLWTFTGIDKEIWGTPGLADTSANGKILIVPSMHGSIYALRLADGGLAWEFRTGAGVASSVVVEAGMAYVGSFDRTFYAIDVETGVEVWARRGQNWFWTTARVENGTVYVVDLDGMVWAWDAATGVPQWERPYDADGPVRARPVLTDDGDTLVTITRSGTIHAIDTLSGLAPWVSAVDVPNSVLADPLLRADRILISNDKGRLFEVRIGLDRVLPVFPPAGA